MTQASLTPSPKWFSVVAVLALIWNLLGVMAFISQIMMTPEMIEEMPKAQQTLYQDIPLWANAAFAVAVIAGTLGCVLLLLKKVLANTLFVLSLLGILVQNYHAFFIADAIGALGMTSIIMPLIVCLVAIALILFASKAEQKHWLG